MSVKQYRNVGYSITHWGLLSPAVSETLQTPAAKSTRPNTSFRQPASGTTFSIRFRHYLERFVFYNLITFDHLLSKPQREKTF